MYSSLHDTQIEPSEREKGKQKWWEAGTNDKDDEKAHGEGSTKALNHTRENLVDDIGVAREQVQNPIETSMKMSKCNVKSMSEPAGRCQLKETQRSAHERFEHLYVRLEIKYKYLQGS